jgi:hypothetical protein
MNSIAKLLEEALLLKKIKIVVKQVLGLKKLEIICRHSTNQVEKKLKFKIA